MRAAMTILANAVGVMVAANEEAAAVINDADGAGPRSASDASPAE